jgi:hypothetical protein
MFEMNWLTDFFINLSGQVLGAIFTMGMLYWFLRKFGTKPIDNRKHRKVFILGFIAYVVVGMLLQFYGRDRDK